MGKEIWKGYKERKIMQIPIEIPDDKISRVIDSQCGLHTPPDGMSRANWAIEQIRKHIIDDVYTWESSEAHREAEESIEKDDNLATTL